MFNFFKKKQPTTEPWEQPETSANPFEDDPAPAKAAPWEGKTDSLPEQEPLSTEQSIDLQALARQFSPEEMTILAVTGPLGFLSDTDGEQPPEGQPITTTLGLTAWMEEDGPVNEAPATLVALGDARLIAYLRQRVPRDSMIKVRVRPEIDGTRFFMAGLPEGGFDPDLKAILARQVAPVTRDGGELGTFTLMRALNWFQNEVDWLGNEISLTFDQNEPDGLALDTARAIWPDQSDLDSAMRILAAARLLDQKNADFQGEDGDISTDEFMAAMEPESMQVFADGGFSFWFGGYDLFWGQAIRVNGTVTDGPQTAELE